MDRNNGFCVTQDDCASNDSSVHSHGGGSGTSATSSQNVAVPFNSAAKPFYPASHGGNATSGRKTLLCSAQFFLGSCTDQECPFAHSVEQLTSQQQQRLLSVMSPLTSATVDSTSRHVDAQAPSINSADATQSALLLLQQPLKAALPQRCFYPHAVPGTYYQHLNVKTTCTKTDIERSYKRWRVEGYKKVKSIDPAKADALDRLIVDAKNVLCNEVMRKEYDAMIPSQAAHKSKHPAAPTPPTAAPKSLPPLLDVDEIWR